jgi:SAM-dependent methyltransferase
MIRRLVRAGTRRLRGVVTPHTPAGSVEAPPAIERPYEALLHKAGVDGTVLHREQIYGSGPPNQTPNPVVLDILLRWAGEGLLEVGCGIGAYTAAIAARGIRASGLDTNAGHVAHARHLGRPVGPFDGVSLPYPNRAFDCVAAIDGLAQVPQWEALLRDMARVAARTVVVSVPNIGVLPGMSRHLVGPWHLLEATHVNFFTADILRRALADMFPDWTCAISEYGEFTVNGETFANHVLAVLQRPASP